MIRRATIGDHTGILNCLVKMLDELTDIYPGPNNAISTWINKNLVSGYVLVAEHNGKIIGTFAGSIVFFPWNDEMKILNEEWFFVDKDYRKGGIGIKIIDTVKEFANLHKISVKFDVMCDRDAEKKDRFFEMKGMTYLGGNFIYGMGVRNGVFK